MFIQRICLIAAIGYLATSVTLAQTSDSFLTGGNAAAGEYTGGGATLVAQDPSLAAWTGPWLDQNSIPMNASQVDDTGLAFGSLARDGGSVQFPGLDGARTGRELATPRFAVDETLYMSFLMDATGAFQGEVDSEDFGNIVPGFTFAAFELHQFAVNDGQRELQISVGDNFVSTGMAPGPSLGDFRGDFQLRIQNDNSLAVNLGPNDGGVNLFVLKLDLSSAPASDTVTVYRNPEDLTDESSSTIDAQLSGLDLSFAFTSFAKFDPFFGDLIPDPPEEGAPTFFDELRLGSSFTSVLPLVSGALPGDYDMDSDVDGADFLKWQQDYGLTGEGLMSDGNENGIVDAADYTIWRDNFGASLPATSFGASSGSRSRSRSP